MKPNSQDWPHKLFRSNPEHQPRPLSDEELKSLAEGFALLGLGVCELVSAFYRRYPKATLFGAGLATGATLMALTRRG